MGKLSRYLKQTAKIENHLLDSTGQPKLDIYGQPAFSSKVTVKCRKEPYKFRGVTGMGQFVNYTNTYYFDESVKINIGDRIDGHEVQNVTEYIDSVGKLIGYEVTV